MFTKEIYTDLFSINLFYRYLCGIRLINIFSHHGLYLLFKRIARQGLFFHYIKLFIEQHSVHFWHQADTGFIFQQFLPALPYGYPELLVLLLRLVN